MNPTIREGAKFGAGVVVGYVLIKFFFAFVVIAAIIFGVCSYAVSTPGAVDKFEKKFNLAKVVSFKTNCNVRSKPSRRGKVLGQIPAGASVTTKKFGGNMARWRLIDYKMSEGWVGCMPK